MPVQSYVSRGEEESTVETICGTVNLSGGQEKKFTTFWKWSATYSGYPIQP